MLLTEKLSKNNYLAYLWHALFLALAKNFMDVDTVIPSLLVDSGGTSFHIGLLTAIMVGGTSFAQIFFTPVLSNKSSKKSFLLLGINIRIIALLGLGVLLFYQAKQSGSSNTIWIIFILMTLFSVSGAFAGISYSDILGRSILKHQRKPFFSIRQVISSVGVLLSAFFAAKVLYEYAYPKNYAWLFIIASLALLFASYGFWRIKEIPGSKLSIKGAKDYFRIIYTEIRSNRRLRSYLLLINFLGVSMSLMPFLILYGKEMFGITTNDVGYYLILKVIAGVVVGSVLFYYSKRVKYSTILYSTTVISLIIPILLLINKTSAYFGAYFFLGGVIYTLYKVSIEGILLEVSDHKNRTIDIGIVGAGSILPVLFPIFGGWLIPNYGFKVFFALFSIIILFSFVFIRKLNCKK